MINQLSKLFLFYLVRILSLTYRFEYFNKGNLLEAKKRSQSNNYIMSFWHQNILSVLSAYKGTPHVVLVSQSGDGELAAYCARKLGNKVIRGSSNRDGLKALKIMTRIIKRGTPGAITIDGPKGPSKNVKKGIVEIARLTGACIIPISPLPEKYWTLKRTWDEFRIPKPFSKIKICYGEPIKIDQDYSLYDFQNVQSFLKNELIVGENYLSGLWSTE